MNTLVISKQDAKAFLIHYQGLSKKTSSIIDVFSKLGCIQYDPLNVVGRNPDLVLQSRIKGYDSSKLENLLYKDRLLIDGWDKMLSIYQTSNWSKLNFLRAHHTKSTHESLAYRDSLEALEYIDLVKEYIISNGPTPSAKFTSTGNSSLSWGHKKLTSATLDYLYANGDLGIHSKVNTQKTYDLIENLIPDSILNEENPFKDEEAFIKWYILRRLNSVGFLWNKSGGGWLGYYIYSKTNRSKTLKELLSEKSIMVFQIEDISEPFYITYDVYLQLLNFLSQPKSNIQKQVRFIAPLDNLVWDRDLIEILFGFNYRWEVYTPISKRKYGYYVLPILYGNDLIGRIEFDYYRGGEDLSTKNIWYEPNFKITKTYEKALEKAYKEFLAYLKNSYRP